MSFEVIVETDTLALSSSAHTGRIWVRADTGSDPEEGWSDFPVIILGWWCNAIAELIEGTADEVRLDFMDGPFALCVRRRENSICEIKLEHRRATGKQELPFAHATLREVAQTIVTAANSVLHRCEQEGWTGADMENLSLAAKTLHLRSR